MSVFLDANSLIYAILSRAGEKTKLNRARELLNRDGCILSVQVLSEFTFRAKNPKRGHPILFEEAIEWLKFFVEFCAGIDAGTI